MDYILHRVTQASSRNEPQIIIPVHLLYFIHYAIDNFAETLAKKISQFKNFFSEEFCEICK